MKKKIDWIATILTNLIPLLYLILIIGFIITSVRKLKILIKILDQEFLFLYEIIFIFIITHLITIGVKFTNQFELIIYKKNK